MVEYRAENEFSSLSERFRSFPLPTWKMLPRESPLSLPRNLRELRHRRGPNPNSIRASPNADVNAPVSNTFSTSCEASARAGDNSSVGIAASPGTPCASDRSSFHNVKIPNP